MPHAPSVAARPHADYIAIGLSLACLAHCLALPLAAAFLPLLSTQAEAAWVHWAFVALAAPVSAWALAWPPRGALGPARRYANTPPRRNAFCQTFQPGWR